MTAKEARLHKEAEARAALVADRLARRKASRAGRRVTWAQIAKGTAWARELDAEADRAAQWQPASHPCRQTRRTASARWRRSAMRGNFP